MSHYLFTSESVAIGHPDKVADQIADAILDACLKEDRYARVACEVLVTTGLVIVAGEITTGAHLDYQQIVRKTIGMIGYTGGTVGFDCQSCGVMVAVNQQSPEIAASVGNAKKHKLGAGDQGLMFGYACRETAELMPLPIMLANRLVFELKKLRENRVLPYLRPDAKVQITVEYDENNRPLRVHTVVISTQHAADVQQDTIAEDLKHVVFQLIPAELIDQQTLFYINPSGSFILGGPAADCGVTGRKIIVDTYGGMGHHGGGAFSGKDPTKVDRSVGYAARYVAKNIVATGLADRCEVQLAYAIGYQYPVSIKIDTFGTCSIDNAILARAVEDVFDLTPHGIIEMLDLRRPIYLKTAFGGHFGREDPDFTWERTDQVEKLLKSIDHFQQDA
jgi:S-adenosylmethionine synthetase